MALNVEAVLAHRFAELRQTYNRRDTILYALGLGLGHDPMEQTDLDYLLETRGRVLPSFAVTLASPGMWIREPVFGIDFAKLVHVEQEAIFHQPLSPEATVVATPSITGLYDRGADKGAVLTIERIVTDAETSIDYATVRQTLLLRGDGGFGGRPPRKMLETRPSGIEPDEVTDVPTSPRAALIYRLSGDWNPLHSDPAVAANAGFSRPILHGLATYGIAARTAARFDTRPLASLSCRFCGVVTPGDVLSFQIWRTEPEGCAFEAYVSGRKVLDRGLARFNRDGPIGKG